MIVLGQTLAITGIGGIFQKCTCQSTPYLYFKSLVAPNSVNL